MFKRSPFGRAVLALLMVPVCAVALLWVAVVVLVLWPVIPFIVYFTTPSRKSYGTMTAEDHGT